ncbi:histidine phosphatase family protein [Tessaracoccus lubricantis]|uniref:Histidine phosphatase family protein n=1 Tax=Tessaracoccus lubricantis TaxID=545543 RepID=A0ABP9F5E4_9ACTN
MTLILVRHAKSDWGTAVADRHRPLADRGIRQAPHTGRWVAEHVDGVDLAVVSVATRARATWELLAAHLDPAVRRTLSEKAYTFIGQDLADVVADLPGSARTVLLVGHNPALEELIEIATGRSVPMPTAAVAMLQLRSWRGVTDGNGTVLAAGRPADDQWTVQGP